jgi:hypothetical protein
MANKYTCSDGTRVSEATIKQRLSKVYRELYNSQSQPCWGCNGMAQGSGHIIPKSRAKKLNMTELIWSPVNICPMCHTCNSVMESYKSEEFKKLKCLPLILEVTERFDPERFKLMTL